MTWALAKHLTQTAFGTINARFIVILTVVFVVIYKAIKQHCIDAMCAAETAPQERLASAHNREPVSAHAAVLPHARQSQARQPDHQARLESAASPDALASLQSPPRHSQIADNPALQAVAGCAARPAVHREGAEAQALLAGAPVQNEAAIRDVQPGAQSAVAAVAAGGRGTQNRSALHDATQGPESVQHPMGSPQAQRLPQPASKVKRKRKQSFVEGF